MARSVRKQPLKIAVVLPFYAQQANDMARGVARFARASGRFQLRDVPFVSHREIPKWLARLRPSGAILSLPAHHFEEIRDQLPTDLRMVNISNERLAPEIGGVCSSSEAMVELTHRHLAGAGYKRFALVGPAKSPVFQRRLELLRKRAGNDVDVETFDLSHLVFDETSEPQTDARLQRWLRRLRPPVGIIAWIGYYAQCICLACRKLGLDVPQEVGVLSISDTRACVFATPPISAVRVDGSALGYAAMKLLAGELRGRRPPVEMVQAPPRGVIARGSAEREKAHTENIAGAVAYIEQHAFEGINVEDVVRNTQMISRRKFYEDFVAELGCSPADYIRRLKIARAKELLSTTTLSIKRIAPACGFQSVAQFYDAFNRNVGKTPMAYRTQRHEKSASEKNRD